MNDKEKIKEALVFLDELVEYAHNQGVNWGESWALWQMEKIQKILKS